MNPTNTLVADSDFREICLANLIKTIDDKDFILENTIQKTGKEFTRKRKLTFKNLITFISQSITGSIQRELNKFFQKIKDDEFCLQSVTKSAFTRARAKLRYEAFKKMNQIVVDSFYQNANYHTWKGFRVLAIDGSTLTLPYHPSIKQEFGIIQYGPHAKVGEGRNRSVAKVSMLHDVLNGITLDAAIDNNRIGERELARKHLSHMKPGKDLLLLDRGYPSSPLFYELTKLGINFCVRMKDDWYKEVYKMANDGDTDKIVTFKMTKKKDRDALKQYGDTNPEVTCRLLITMLPNGERVVLCTSLLDEETYPYECFYEIYHSRWKIEEKFKLLKCRIGMDIFSGKTANAVRQDFYAKVFMATVAAVMSFPVREIVNKKPKQRNTRHSYQINATNAVAGIKQFMTSILLKGIIGKVLQAFDHLLQNTLEIVRPHRSIPRGNTQRKPPGMAYKGI